MHNKYQYWQREVLKFIKIKLFIVKFKFTEKHSLITFDYTKIL